MPISFDSYLVNVNSQEEMGWPPDGVRSPPLSPPWLIFPKGPFGPAVCKTSWEDDTENEPISNGEVEWSLTGPTSPSETLRRAKRCDSAMTFTSSEGSADRLDDEFMNLPMRKKSHSCPGCLQSRRLATTEPPKRRRKSVSFADDHGMPLITVKSFQKDPWASTPPSRRRSSSGHQLPGGAHFYLETSSDDLALTKRLRSFSLTIMEAQFDQPVQNFDNFLERVNKQMVCLENAYFPDHYHVMGTVRVRNVAYQKEVTLRVTYNDWQTHRDVMAWWVGKPSNYLSDTNQTIEDHSYDRFRFTVGVPPGPVKLQMAIRYRAGEKEWWDNNQGMNYTFRQHDVLSTM